MLFDLGLCGLFIWNVCWGWGGSVCVMGSVLGGVVDVIVDGCGVFVLVGIFGMGDV